MTTLQEICDEISKLNKHDVATHAERMCKVAEEFGELAQSVNKTIGRKTNTLSEKQKRAEILEEGADTIQTIISLLDGYDIGADEILKSMVKKNKKWGAVIVKRELEKKKQKLKNTLNEQ